MPIMSFYPTIIFRSS